MIDVTRSMSVSPAGPVPARMSFLIKRHRG